MDFEFITDETQRAKAVESYNASISEIAKKAEETIAAKFEEEKKKLVANNQRLLQEKGALAEKLKGVSDIDKMMEIVNAFNESEEMQLAKSGKLQEHIQKLVTEKTIGLEEQILRLKTDNERLDSEGKTIRTKYNDTKFREILDAAGDKAKLPKSSMIDVYNRANGLFSLAKDEKSLEARGKDGKLVMADDKVLTVDLWIEGLRKDAPHLWPSSKGGSLHGNYDPMTTDAKIVEVAATGDMKSYRELRKSKK